VNKIHYWVKAAEEAPSFAEDGEQCQLIQHNSGIPLSMRNTFLLSVWW
jgi:hypothetical protein